MRPTPSATANQLRRYVKSWEQVILLDLENPAEVQTLSHAFVLISQILVGAGLASLDQNWTKFLPLHLNLITFWLAVTTLMAVIASRSFDTYAATQKSQTIVMVVCALIIIQVFRSPFSLRQKLIYAPLLTLNAGIFANAIV